MVSTAGWQVTRVRSREGHRHTGSEGNRALVQEQEQGQGLSHMLSYGLVLPVRLAHVPCTWQATHHGSKKATIRIRAGARTLAGN